MSASLTDPGTTDRLPVSVGDLDRAALERLGIRYERRDDMPLTDLDDEASRAAWNQARLGDPVDEEHVEQLLSELERGAEFPPIIFYRDNEGRAVTLSGNHRRRTHEVAGRTTINAYEATGLSGLRKEDPRVLLLIYEANRGHGKGVSIEDRVHQAIVLIRNGYTVRAAASALGIPENRVRDQYDAARATERLEDELGVDTTGIPISAQRRLVAIRNDKVAKDAAEVARKMERKTQEVNELVKAVNGARTEDEQLAVVRDYAEALDARLPAPGAPKRGQAAGVSAELRRFDTSVGTILRFDVESLRSGIPNDFRDRLVERVHKATEVLAAAEKVL
jgi:hypothetical protein